VGEQINKSPCSSAIVTTLRNISSRACYYSTCRRGCIHCAIRLSQTVGPHVQIQPVHESLSPRRPWVTLEVNDACCPGIPKSGGVASNSRGEIRKYRSPDVNIGHSGVLTAFGLFSYSVHCELIPWATATCRTTAPTGSQHGFTRAHKRFHQAITSIRTAHRSGM
jgi:hypothetical protein